MNKINVIIRHEYITRVKSKWFIISTLLGPLGMALLIAVPVLAAMLAGDGAEGKVAVLDRSGSVGAMVVASDTGRYEDAGRRTLDELASDVREERIQAYVIVPENVLDSGKLTLYSRGGTGLAFESSVEDDFEPFIVKGRLQRVGTDTSVIDLVEQGVSLEALKITEEGVEQDASKASAAIGYGAGFVIYMLIFLYGSMVMRGVVEEKTNRIIEVIASSARPFEIMMGKVVGIGLVGLTQLIAWLILGTAVIFALGAILGSNVDPAQVTQSTQMMQQMQGANSPMMIGDVALPQISIFSIVLFLFYFLAGYFIYATLFAAVGSAVDQESDAQSLTLPITFPVILTMLFIGNVVAAPNSVFAIVMSMIPLFTPILMTVRVAATDVPWWQVTGSIILSIAAFFGAVWAAARIYRIGILSYGKKPKLSEIARWLVS